MRFLWHFEENYLLKEKLGMIEEQSLSKEELIMTLTAELPVLRARLGISQQKAANCIGISRQTYGSIETGIRKMSWTVFMALIALFDMNEATSVMLDQMPYFISSVRQITQD